MTAATIVFAALAYLSGSVLYANVFGTIFGKKELYQNSADKNPGTANAYIYGGFLCGTLTLICDLLKGFLPVFMYLRFVPEQEEWGLALVLAAPVIGHIFPLFSKFHGGKGIAATFGSLLGLCPYFKPVLIFAAVFVFLSTVLRINPHFYRTLFAYIFTAALFFCGVSPAVKAGFIIITAAVCVRLCFSREEKENPEVKLLWTR